MGQIVNEKARALKAIGDAAAAANSVPALRDQVQALSDEVQNLKDALIEKGDIQDD